MHFDTTGDLRDFLERLGHLNPALEKFLAPSIQAIDRTRAGRDAQQRRAKALEALRQSDGLTIADVADEVGVEYVTAARYVRLFRKRGLLTERVVRAPRRNGRPEKLFSVRKK